MLKNIHEPSRNNTVEMTGIPHNLFTFFPAKTPIITEYIGFMAKNNIKHTAIPPSPFIKETASHGKANMITAEIINQSIKLFFILYLSPIANLQLLLYSWMMDFSRSPITAPYYINLIFIRLCKRRHQHPR